MNFNFNSIFSTWRFKLSLSIVACVCALLSTTVFADAGSAEAAIRKNLGERISALKSIDEITKSPIAGLYEIRVGSDIYYSDAEGNFLIQGEMIDTKNRRNLTEARIEKLTAIEFANLPIKDAFTIVRGNGKRKMAVFEDPNCGYCKRFERDLQKVNNVTIYLFLYPILGPDSIAKSQNIWCSADKSKTWLNWMVRDQAAPVAHCEDAVLQRNVEFGMKHKIKGTPALIFADGTRVPGAIAMTDVENLLGK